MVRKIRRQNKRGVEVSLGTVIDGFVKGIGGLLGLAAKLEEEGKDEYAEQGEIKGKTKSGKEYRGAYGLRVKVGLPVRSRAKAGLNPEDFSAQGGSPPSPGYGRTGALGGKGRKNYPTELTTNKT